MEQKKEKLSGFSNFMRKRIKRRNEQMADEKSESEKGYPAWIDKMDDDTERRRARAAHLAAEKWKKRKLKQP